jgi:hypothetical protein
VSYEQPRRRDGREVTNEDLRALGVAFFVLTWARAVFAALGAVALFASLVALFAYDQALLGVVFGLSLAGLALLQIGVFGWMLWARPAGTRQLCVHRALFGQLVLVLSGLCVAGAFGMYSLGLGVLGVFLLLCAVLITEYDLPSLIVELAWMTGAEHMVERATGSVRSTKFADLFVVAVTMFLPLIWPYTVVVYWPLAGLLLLPSCLTNTRLLWGMHRYLAGSTVDDVRHARSELEEG